MDDQKLEATLGLILDKLGGLENRFDGLENRFDGLQADITSLKADVTTLKADVGRIDRRQVVMAGDIRNLRNDMTVVIDHIAYNYEKAVGELQDEMKQAK